MEIGIWKILVVFVGVLLVACGSTPTPTPQTDLYELFQLRLREGADCPRLFAIRNQAVPKSQSVEKMNSQLNRIGCNSSSSSRTDLGITTPTPGITFTVLEYRIYRAVIDTPMSVSEAQAISNAATKYGVSPTQARDTTEKAMSALAQNNWFGRPENEIRHASDWAGQRGGQ